MLKPIGRKLTRTAAWPGGWAGMLAQSTEGHDKLLGAGNVLCLWAVVTQIDAEVKISTAINLRPTHLMIFILNLDLKGKVQESPRKSSLPILQVNVHSQAACLETIRRAAPLPSAWIKCLPPHIQLQATSYPDSSVSEPKTFLLQIVLLRSDG